VDGKAIFPVGSTTIPGWGGGGGRHEAAHYRSAFYGIHVERSIGCGKKAGDNGETATLPEEGVLLAPVLHR